ncbi:MAG TPA: hypothetical protein VN089_04915, partial [Duganella sp.]|nr:hypothetical protein [Duganella sp.]
RGSGAAALPARQIDAFWHTMHTYRLGKITFENKDLRGRMMFPGDKIASHNRRCLINSGIRIKVST